MTRVQDTRPSVDRELPEPQQLVCVTGQQEWLIRDGICRGVRDLQSGEWLEDHFALDERVQMVPAKRAPHGGTRWNLQVFSFGMNLQRGPVLEVRAAGAEALRSPGYQLATRCCEVN